MSLRGKLESRKFWLAFTTMIVTTLLLAIPPWFGVTLITGTEWVSAIGIIFTAYVGGNVLEKRLDPLNGTSGVEININQNEEGEA